MITSFIFLLIGAGILAILGPIIWIVFIIYAATRANDVVGQVSSLGGFDGRLVTSDLDAVLGQLDQMLRAAGTGRALGGHGGGAHLSPEAQLQIQ